MSAVAISNQTCLVSLANGGGTISCPHESNAPLETVNRQFHEQFHQPLEANDIKIAEPVVEIFPQRIESENMTMQRFKILTRKLIEMIKDIKKRKLDSKLIVVTFGTDAMDKVLNLLAFPRLLRRYQAEQFTEPERNNYVMRMHNIVRRYDLADMLDELDQLIEENDMRIVFTASNTSKEEDVRANFVNACKRVKHLDRDDFGPGIYVYHRGVNSHLVPAEFAVKVFMEKRHELPQMHYVKRTKEQKHHNQIRDEVIKPQVAAIEELDLQPVFGDHKAVTYDVTWLRDDHNEFRQTIKNDVEHKIKAVLLVLYHGGTANADPQTPNASVAKLVEDIRRQRKDISFFAVTENYEPLTLEAYKSSETLRKAGVVPLYNMKKETAELKSDKLVKIYAEPCKLIVEMLKAYADKLKTPDIDVELINQDHIAELRNSYQAVGA